MAKHWHAMNGSSGCMPDNNEVHTSKESAARSMASLFDEQRGVYTGLMRDHIFYFHDPGSTGAGYCEIVRCEEEECNDNDY